MEPGEKKITVVIIDNPKKNACQLESYLNNTGFIDIIGRTSNTHTAIKLVKTKVPDLVFIDVESLGNKWLDIVRSVKSCCYRTKIILTADNHHHAYKSLDAEPFDYLLKPLGTEVLYPVLERYKSSILYEEFERKISHLMQMGHVIPKIRLPIYEGTLFVTHDDIMMLKADLNYCHVYTINKREETVLLSMSKVAALFDSLNIFKASRSSYINIRYLTSIEKKTLTCTLKYEDYMLEVSMGKSYVKLLEKMNIIPS